MVVGEWSVALGGRGKAALPASQVGGGVMGGCGDYKGWCIDCFILLPSCGLKTWVNSWLRYWDVVGGFKHMFHSCLDFYLGLENATTSGLALKHSNIADAFGVHCMKWIGPTSSIRIRTSCCS